jgi:hypothetical protein
MTLRVSIPGGEDLLLRHLVLDVNGTSSDRGRVTLSIDEALGLLADARTLTATLRP